jgi:hypothetical protein
VLLFEHQLASVILLLALWASRPSANQEKFLEVNTNIDKLEMFGPDLLL